MQLGVESQQLAGVKSAEYFRAVKSGSSSLRVAWDLRLCALQSDGRGGRDNQSLFPLSRRWWEKSCAAIVRQVDTKAAGVRPLILSYNALALYDKKSKKEGRDD